MRDERLEEPCTEPHMLPVVRDGDRNLGTLRACARVAGDADESLVLGRRRYRDVGHVVCCIGSAKPRECGVAQVCDAAVEEEMLARRGELFEELSDTRDVVTPYRANQHAATVA
jgi:hypothetical protein